MITIRYGGLRGVGGIYVGLHVLSKCVCMCVSARVVVPVHECVCELVWRARVSRCVSVYVHEPTSEQV